MWNWTVMHTSIIIVSMRYRWAYLMLKTMSFTFAGSELITFIVINVSCQFIAWAKISLVNSWIWLFWHKGNSNKIQKENQATRTQINMAGEEFSSDSSMLELQLRCSACDIEIWDLTIHWDKRAIHSSQNYLHYKTPPPYLFLNIISY